MDALKIDWTAENYINHNDLNKIEEWSKYLNDRLAKYGYHAKYEEGKVWTNKDIPSVSDMDRIRNNVTGLRDGYFSIPEWRDLILGQSHDFDQQNAIEWDLQTCYNWIELMIQIFPPCGVWNCGNVYYLTDEMHFWPVIPYPVLTGEYTYNGKPQIPVLTDGENVERSGDTAPTDAGDYTLTIKPKRGYKWETGVRTKRSYAWTVKKAAGTIDAVSEYSMGRDNFDAKIPISYDGDGAVSVSADSPALLIVDANKDFVHVVSQNTGTVTLTISAAEGRNYLPASHTITVTITDFAKTAIPSGVAESGAGSYLVSN